jgi:hypothetical protein
MSKSVCEIRLSPETRGADKVSAIRDRSCHDLKAVEL